MKHRDMTQQEAYGLLADFIQDYIYRKGWDRLNPMQVKAIEYIIPARENVLLTAGTAMGKTEAAFLPAITVIYNDKKNDTKQGVGILYISPLKALINDQFLRQEEMLAGSGIRLTKWHGDAADSGKDRLLDDPGGILQMTPESLEAMFCCHPERIITLFSELRFIVIDEIHYFMDNERGLQLLALLELLSMRAGCRPVRIGLSATVSDTEAALAWLGTGSRRKGKVISYHEEGHRVVCSVTSTPIGKEEFPERYIKKIFYQTRGKRALLFACSRAMTEAIISRVRKMALASGLPDVYHVHHGSIGRELREDTERVMKMEEGPVLTGTTLTLELGIDIGSLEEVIQTDAPYCISAMVQRLGRSGRRTGQSAISFQLRHQPDKGERKRMDLTLVRSIAMIELYFREKYLEKPCLPRLPYHFLVHRILALLSEKGCLQPRKLASHLLELSVFAYVSHDDLRDLLLHLLEKKVLCMYDDGAIGLDDRGEAMVGSMDFYAVFVAEVPMTVYCQGTEIGTIDRAYRPGDCFFLAGSSWEVTDRDMSRKRLEVIEAEEEADISFGGYGEVVTDRRLMEKIHEILSSDTDYAYLDEDAKGVLKEIRAKAFRYHLIQSEANSVSPLKRRESGSSADEEISRDSDGSLLLMPALSGKTILTIYHILKAHDVACERICCRDFLYGIRIRGMRQQELTSLMRKLAARKHMIDYGYVNRFVRVRGKYYDLLPENLKGKEIISDVLDMEGAREYFKYCFPTLF